MRKSKGQKLIDGFAEDAQHWGWQQECAFGKTVTNAEKDYLVSKDALEEHMKKLEDTIKKYRDGHV